MGTELNYRNIPDEDFVNVTLVRDICKASILPRNKVEMGAPDIVMLSPVTGEYRITRKELVSNFVYLDGRAIKLSAWRNNSQNLVMRKVNNNSVNLVATHLSAKFTPEGRDGCYLICGVDSIGRIDKNKCIELSDKIFRKLLAMQEVLPRVMELRNGTLNNMDSTYGLEKSADSYSDNEFGDFVNIRKDSNASTGVKKVSVNSGIDDNWQDNESKSRDFSDTVMSSERLNEMEFSSASNQYKVVSKLNNGNKLYGFKLAKDDKEIDVTTAGMIQLVKRGLVSGVRLENNGDSMKLVGKVLSNIESIEFEG